MLKIDFWNIAFIFINLLVWYWFVRRFLWGPVSAIIEQRQKQVEKDLDEAQQDREAAQEMKQHYEASIADAKQEAEAILADARVKADAKYAATLQKAQQDADRKLEDAQRNIALEKEKRMRELEQEIAGLAMDAAEKLLTEGHDSSYDDRMYDAFLRKEGNANG